ncbi:MAG TPA: TetR family transcriptional regulator [Solirubrobacteraceae bacterium]|jgi:AcrR family transcriptional regulator|nr:TetR family transcriptional regulator [Solirubrobacteraceae bacterium]
MSPKTARRTKSKLDREAVLDVAMGLADTEGLEAITFRRLAEQFEVTPMALYWHFEDKDALLGALADRLWVHAAEALTGSLAQLPPDDDGWGQLRLTLDALVDAMRPHPAVAELVPTRVLESEAGREVTELTLGFLEDQGFDGVHASDLGLFILSSAVMLVTTQTGSEIPEPGERAEHQRRKRIALASLPPERYPHIIACAGYLTDCESPDSYFAHGCEAIIAGVRAQAPAG